MNFDEIYKHYFQDVYHFMLALCHNEALAEEITQETFYKALQNIEHYKGQCKINVWLCQIAKNTYFTHVEKQKRFVQEQTEQEDDLKIEQQLLKKEQAFYLHQLVHRLDEPYKEVFSLRVFGELSFSQISLLFDKTESWARVTFYRAKKKIQNMMED